MCYVVLIDISTVMYNFQSIAQPSATGKGRFDDITIRGLIYESNNIKNL